MSRVYYQLFFEDILALSRTLVIKCAGVAEVLNRELKSMGVRIDDERPETWKYYLNLAGEYHATDTPMTVRSMDTLEEIAFTKENLRLHRATAREYQPGGRYYQELTRRYPTQVPLINGILFPVDVQKAIEAEDGTLLYYDASRVESNETNLIPRLQQWLYRYFSRWHNRSYTLVDDLYLSAFLGILYLQLPSVLFNLRLRNVQTPQAHSFHIREYFASHGRLDEYLPYLTKAQQLYLYRNLRYLTRNVGKQDIFKELVENLLTPRGIPLAAYRLKHNVEKLPEAIYPEVELSKHPINFGYNQSGLDRTSVHTILTRERPMARENRIVEDNALREIHEQVRSGAFNQLPTKVLESEVIDRSNSSVRSLMSVLLNQWLHLATTGRYRAYVTLSHPQTGAGMTMSVKDAFIVALYCFTRAREIDLPTIPRMIAYEVLRTPLPNHQELAQIVDRRYVPEGMIQAIQDRITPLGEYITTERFHSACVNLHREYLKLWELYSFQEHYLTRGFCEQLVRRHFMHVPCDLVEQPTSFDDWLKAGGYDFETLTRGEMEQLLMDAINITTGLNLTNRVTLSEIQSALLRLMGQLSSYSVQYLKNINQSDYRLVGIPAIRVGDVGSRVDGYYRFSGSRITALRVRGQHHREWRLPYLTTMPTPRLRQQTRARICLDPHPPLRVLPQNFTRLEIPVADVGVRTVQVDWDHPEPSDNHLGQYRPDEV